MTQENQQEERPVIVKAVAREIWQRVKFGQWGPDDITVALHELLRADTPAEGETCKPGYVHLYLFDAIAVSDIANNRQVNGPRISGAMERLDEEIKRVTERVRTMTPQCCERQPHEGPCCVMVPKPGVPPAASSDAPTSEPGVIAAAHGYARDFVNHGLVDVSDAEGEDRTPDLQKIAEDADWSALLNHIRSELLTGAGGASWIDEHKRGCLDCCLMRQIEDAIRCHFAQKKEG